jgi:23S rRNA pseudouridine2605 synthase
MDIRLQKVLAAAGLGSRRKCEEFIVQGRVTVDDVVVDELGARVNPTAQVIRVDGVRIAQAQGKVVFALHKPLGVVTTMSDPQGRPCVGDLVAHLDQRLFHVGRLDADTSGLLLLTNDGDLAQRLGHPSFGVAKTYVAKVSGAIEERRLTEGVPVDGRVVEVTGCRVRSRGPRESVVELTIHEGRNRIVRRLLEQLGHPVIELARTQVGPVRLAGLPVGGVRALDNRELGELYSQVGL